jgi:hypothetical protein
MKDYDVVTVDDEKIGRVVDDARGSLIVERGLVIKTRHAIPHKLAEVDETHRRVVVTVSKQAVKRSPRVFGEEPDERAVASYYGLAQGDPEAPTKGDGVLVPDDPALTAEQEAERVGIEPEAERRAQQNEQMGALGKGPLDVPPGGWDRGAARQPRKHPDD